MLTLTLMKKVCKNEENQKIIKTTNRRMSNSGQGMILGKRKFIENIILGKQN